MTIVLRPPLDTDLAAAAATAGGFLAGTLLRTPCGDVPVQDLAPGDRIITRDRGAQRVRRILRRVDATLRPVRIAAHALGPNLPESDLFLGPGHRVLLHSTGAERLFGLSEVLLPAHQIVAPVGSGPTDGLEFFEIVTGHADLILANGAYAETLAPAAPPARPVPQGPGVAALVRRCLPERPRLC